MSGSEELRRTCSCFVAAASTNLRLFGSSSESMSSSARTGVLPVARVTNTASANLSDSAIVHDCPLDANFPAGFSFSRIARSSRWGPITVTA